MNVSLDIWKDELGKASANSRAATYAGHNQTSPEGKKSKRVNLFRR
jgi:hypothetical protein